MLFLKSGRFGALPEGAELARVLASPHQAGGVFQNFEPMRIMTTNDNMLVGLIRWLTTRAERTKPAVPLPGARENLAALHDDTIVWLGHSSFFLRLAGLNILVDPVLSDYASPVFFANRAFAGTLPYLARDMPAIDLLLVSHDHWDHLDYATLQALKGRVRLAVCGLGTGAHLLRWGYEAERVRELDWEDSLEVGGLGLTMTTSRHFSGRTLSDRDRALWGGFVLETARRKIYFSGDGGYGRHFADIGRRHGPFDLVLLDSGQYNVKWPHVHMFPEQAAQAAEDLGACSFMPAHIGRFCLSEHPWDEPFRRQEELARGRPYSLFQPLIGKAVPLERRMPAQPCWWEGLEPAEGGK